MTTRSAAARGGAGVNKISPLQTQFARVVARGAAARSRQGMGHLPLSLRPGKKKDAHPTLREDGGKELYRYFPLTINQSTSVYLCGRAENRYLSHRIPGSSPRADLHEYQGSMQVYLSCFLYHDFLHILSCRTTYPAVFLPPPPRHPLHAPSRGR